MIYYYWDSVQILVLKKYKCSYSCTLIKEVVVFWFGFEVLETNEQKMMRLRRLRRTLKAFRLGLILVTFC